MLLAVDVGNSNLKIGAFAGGRLVRQCRIVTDLKRPSEWYARALRSFSSGLPTTPTAVIAGSVVPAFDRTLRRATKAAFGINVLDVNARSKLGLRLRVRIPAQIGTDRYLNALALKKMVGGPAIGIDFGSATTFDCIDVQGDFIGGAILLGPKTTAQALHHFTAKLPLVKVRKPRRAIGKATVESLEVGLYYGYLGMIREVLRRTMAEMGGRPVVVVTGGAARLFLADLPGVRFFPDLTMYGLRFAYDILHHG